MSWLIVGTVPYEGFPLVEALCSIEDGGIKVGDQSFPVMRGTPALIAAACLTSQILGFERPRALLAGDIGRGDGSRIVYQHMLERLPDNGDRLVVFHYLLPDVQWHDRILMSIESAGEQPILVADAGYMYAAKMSGSAPSYDLFTPDAGELAFLADENAPHPFYTRGFLLQDEDRVLELVRRAYVHENAAQHLLVKGRRDVVACADGVLAEVTEPCIDAMEPIGGTGDSLTGIVAALINSGTALPDAALAAARANRLLGALSNPSPASSIADLLPVLPQALDTVLSQ